METERAQPTIAGAVADHQGWAIIVGHEAGGQCVYEFEAWGDWVICVRHDPPPW